MLYKFVLDVKDMWKAVKQLTGGSTQDVGIADGITAESLNKHYTGNSTDTAYQ